MDEQQSAIVISGVVVVLLALGGLILLYGAWNFLRALVLTRRCTQRADATVERMVDHDAGRLGRKRAGRAAIDERDGGRVLAANEAIAAKKRAYRKKRLEQARREADEALATWSVVVRWRPSQAGARRAGDEGWMTLEGARRHRRSRFSEGQVLHVCYDPARPSVAYIAEEGTPRTFGLTLMGCGAALVAIGVICWFVLPVLARSY